ncbi:hypothetical protein AB0I28_04885 [Phytomonospora sp. NPDC050363]|uniref:NADase-type glycan-binding domain-containing protein n=1 Tax=Phytomonospora sp. NPDC050363 TaxID=3155642 RepID=UPI0033FA4E7D
MTVCNRCGAAVTADDQFCGSCGEYLEWDETPGQAGQADPGAADTQVAASAQNGGSTTAAAIAQQGTTAATAAPAFGRQVPQMPTAPKQPTPPRHTEPPPVQPGQVAEQPIRPRPAHVERPAAPPIELLGTDQVRCGPCGAANDDTRKFCRRCGASLAAETGPAEVKLSWWRRLFRKRGPEDKKWYAAGHRRSQRRIRIMRIVGILLVIAIVLGVIAAWPARSYVDAMVNTVKDRFTEHVPIVPSDVRTSSSTTGTKAQNLLDGIADKYWAPGGDGLDEWVEVEFNNPVRIVDLVVSSGASRAQDQFLTQARPEKLVVTMTAEDGKETIEEITLVDQADPQTFGLGVSDVVTVKLTVKSAYGYEHGKAVAIAELEFFTRK